jgi:hypothetical protein
VIVELPNSADRAAYETILVILKQGQPPVQPVEVINKVKVVTDVRITFEEEEDDDECSNEPGSAGLAFPHEKKTECQLEKFQDCAKDRLKGIKWGDDCKDNNHAFDDDCDGFANKEECDEYWNTPKPVLPICGTPEAIGAELCTDDGDEITCDGPEIPVGNECVLPEDDVVCPAHSGGCESAEDPIITGDPIKDAGDPETGEIIGENLIEDKPVEEIPDVPEEVEEVETEEIEEETTEEESNSEGTDSGVN